MSAQYGKAGQIGVRYSVGFVRGKVQWYLGTAVKGPAAQNLEVEEMLFSLVHERKNAVGLEFQIAEKVSKHLPDGFVCRAVQEPKPQKELS